MKVIRLPLLLMLLLFHQAHSSPVQQYNPLVPSQNRRVFEALFSPYVTAASIVPKPFSGTPWWIPHAYFNLCDTVDMTEDSLWAYGCSPNGPGPNSVLPGANIPRPTYPYDETDDKGVGVLNVPMPQVHPELDYYAAFWMQQNSIAGTVNNYGAGGGERNWFLSDMPQGFWG